MGSSETGNVSGVKIGLLDAEESREEAPIDEGAASACEVFDSLLLEGEASGEWGMDELVAVGDDETVGGDREAGRKGTSVEAGRASTSDALMAMTGAE